jgi:L-ascorbate metabolism protein UlaG (beta-lactamase superfamily)
MSAVHMAPEEAIKAHRILGSAVSLAIHHGTFQMADEGIDAAQEQILTSQRPDSFLVLKNGESIVIA